MPLALRCPYCLKRVEADDEHLGLDVACGFCGGRFRASPVNAAPPDPADATAQPTHAVDSGEHPADHVNPHAPAAPGEPPDHRFTFTCQRCGSALEGRTRISGRPGRCPTCGAVFVVPRVDPRTGLPAGPAVTADDGELPTPMHAYAAAGDKAPRIRRLPNDDQVIDCPRCGMSTGVEADICPRCGLPYTIEGAAAVVRAAPAEGNGLSRLSVVLGTIALPTFCIPVPILGMAAVLVGITAWSRSPVHAAPGAGRREALIGILLGLGSIAMTLLFIRTWL